jgi:hypothetical protein
MAEKQSRTFNGLTSTLRDNLKMALGTALAPLFDRMKAGLTWVAEFTKSPAFSAGVTALSLGMEYFGKVADSAIQALLKGLQFTISTVKFFGQNWRDVWEFVVQQGFASVSLLHDRFKYMLNEQLPFSIAALWEGMVAGGKEAAKHIKTFFEATFDFFKEMFLAIFDSISARFDGMRKAWEQVKAGNLGDAFDELVKGQVKSGQVLGQGAMFAAQNFAQTTGSATASIGAEIAKAMSGVMAAMPEFKPSGRTTELQAAAGSMFAGLLGKFAAAMPGNFFSLPAAATPAGATPDIAGPGGIGEAKAAGKKAKSEFLAIDELNKKIQTALTDKEAKDRKATARATADTAKNTGDLAKALVNVDQKIADKLAPIVRKAGAFA